MKALIVADGDIPARSVIEHLDRDDGSGGSEAATPSWLVVAADGGALKAEMLGLRPDAVVGDADSLSPEDVERLRSEGIEVIVHPQAKDRSDTELAVREALQRGATRVVVVGATGGIRLDHTMANLLLLALPDLAHVDISLVDGASTLRVIGAKGEGHLALDGSAGDYVSLLPLSDHVDGVTTQGLRYPLSDDTLWLGQTRGLSNELEGTHASVTTRSGRLAVVHTRLSEVEPGD